MKTRTTLDENRCIISGEISIEGTLHKVESKFVKCNPSLNNSAWNVTEPKKKCRDCFPVSLFGAQLTIFDQGA